MNLSGECAYPAGAQEGRHLRFPPSCAPARRQRSSVRFSSDTPPLGKEVKIIG